MLSPPFPPPQPRSPEKPQPLAPQPFLFCPLPWLQAQLRPHFLPGTQPPPQLSIHHPPHRAPESLSMPRVDPAPPCSQPSQGFPVPWFRGNLWHQSYQPLWPCLPSFLPPVILQSHQTPANPLTSSGVHEQLRASAPAAPLPLATFLYPDTW